MAKELFKIEIGNNETRKKIDAIDLVSLELRKDGVPPMVADRVYRHMPPDVVILSPSTVNYQCNEYAIGCLSPKHLMDNAITKDQVPKAGDIIFYVGENANFHGITHVGVYQKDGTVISKWGDGPLVWHTVESVPTEYGNEASFSRINWHLIAHYREAFRDVNVFQMPADYDAESILNNFGPSGKIVDVVYP
jgi:hypothetical protein